MCRESKKKFVIHEPFFTFALKNEHSGSYDLLFSITFL